MLRRLSLTGGWSLVPDHHSVLQFLKQVTHGSREWIRTIRALRVRTGLAVAGG